MGSTSSTRLISIAHVWLLRVVTAADSSFSIDDSASASTSAVNATLFGTARLGEVMAKDEALPHAFSVKERTQDIPWVSLCIICAITLLFVNLGDLTVISAFASSTFLLIFAGIDFSAFRLRQRIEIAPIVPLAGMLLCLLSWLTLCGYLAVHDRRSRSVCALESFSLRALRACRSRN